MMYIYNVISDMDENIYRKILLEGRKYCSELILVARNDIGLSKNAIQFLSSISQDLIEKSNVTEWPGTKLLAGHAWCYRYRYSHNVIGKLLSETSTLFEWEQPDLPEDLCLMRRKGEPWLVTISHEEDCYFKISDEEAKEIMGEIPELNLRRS